MFFDKNLDVIVATLPPAFSSDTIKQANLERHAFKERPATTSLRSVGWVMPRDILSPISDAPTNSDFVECTLPLTLRTDAYSLNPKILKAHVARDIQEFAKTHGLKKVHKDTRFEIEEKTKDRLLKTQSPRTSIIEALVDIKNRLLFIAASAKGATYLCEYFRDTFGSEPTQVTPSLICKQVAERIPGADEQLALAHFNPENGAHSVIAASAITFQFFLWLWAESETHDHVVTPLDGNDQLKPYYAHVSGDVIFRHLNGNLKTISLSGQRATASAEATAALTAGAFPISYDIIIGTSANTGFEGHLHSDRLGLTRLKIPGYPSGREIPYNDLPLLAAHLRGFLQFIEAVFSDFLTRRLIPELWVKAQETLSNWIATRAQPDTPKADPNAIQKKILGSIMSNLQSELEALNAPKES